MPKSATELAYEDLLRNRDIFRVATWGVPLAAIGVFQHLDIPNFWSVIYAVMIGVIFNIKRQEYDDQIKEIVNLRFEEEQRRMTTEK